LFLAFGGARAEGVVERARVGGARHLVVVVEESKGVGVRVAGRVRSREARPRREKMENDMAAVEGRFGLGIRKVVEARRLSEVRGLPFVNRDPGSWALCSGSALSSVVMRQQLSSSWNWAPRLAARADRRMIGLVPSCSSPDSVRGDGVDVDGKIEKLCQARVRADQLRTRDWIPLAGRRQGFVEPGLTSLVLPLPQSVNSFHVKNRRSFIISRFLQGQHGRRPAGCILIILLLSCNWRTVFSFVDDVTELSSSLKCHKVITTECPFAQLLKLAQPEL
jgi:hypothetical protein